MDEKYLYGGLIYFSNRENFIEKNKIKLIKYKIIDKIYFNDTIEYCVEASLFVDQHHSTCYIGNHYIDKEIVICNTKDTLYISFYSLSESNVRNYLDDKVEELKEYYLKEMNKCNNRYEELCKYNYIITEDYLGMV